MTERVGRFELERELGRRGPLVDHLGQTEDEEFWLVTVWTHDRSRVDAAHIEAALGPVRALGAPHPDAAIEVLVDEHGDAIALARPVLPGATLRELVSRDGPRDPKGSLALAMSLLRSLASLRAASPGIEHVGISPAVIWLEAGDTPVIAGFPTGDRVVSQSLADPSEGDPPWVQVVDGDYSPPELRIGNHISGATDIYGVAGSVLFALTGDTPRSFTSQMNDLEQVLISQHRAPRLLARFLAQALSPTAEERYPSIEAALDELTGRAEARAREEAAAAAAAMVTAVGVFSPEGGPKKSFQMGVAAIAALLSLPFLAVAVSALVPLAPFPRGFSGWAGGVVALLMVGGVVAQTFALVRAALTMSVRKVRFDETFLRVEADELLVRSQWTALREIRKSGPFVELVGAWSNGSGGWLPTDLLRLAPVYRVSQDVLLQAVLDEHAKRSPGGFLRMPSSPRRGLPPWLLVVPAGLVAMLWIAGLGLHATGATGPSDALLAAARAPVDEFIESPSLAFESSERDEAAAQAAREALEAALKAVPLPEEDDAPSDGRPPCPTDMQSFALVEGAVIPPACLDSGGVMVRAARPAAGGPAWFLVGWTEVPNRSYGACAAVGTCPLVAPADGCRADMTVGGDLPANCVSREGAAKYCATVGRRLCTTNEWYAAAGASNKAERTAWPVGAPGCNTAVVRDARGPGCGSNEASAVGARMAGVSRWGAVDMVGNMAEWVSDHPNGNPLGGSWLSAPGSRGIQSLEFGADGPARDVGFRCCRDLPIPAPPADP
jgi:hypothetical protein